MPNIITPKINKIVRLRTFDLNATPIQKGNMYMCLDTLTMYYDQDDSNRVRYIYKGVKTRKDMLYNITPSMNTTYYCWEDNSLWLWMNKWISIYSNSQYPSAYIVDNEGIRDVYNYNSPNAPIDNNGLLGDGSVVIRDENRLIKGKIYIDTDENNLIISSYFGGGTRILPNGQMSTKGELYLNANEDEEYGSLDSHIVGPFSVQDGELYVDYSNNPGKDDNPYKNDSHRYKVYHEGNLLLNNTRSLNISTFSASIGNGKDKQFTISHNLNSSNIIVQFRDTTTGKQLDLYNVATNNNELLVSTEEVLQNNQVLVNIIKI